MTLTISDTAMTSDRSHCTARHSPDRNGWEVSWLPGQILDRNTAITAMTLADTAAEHDLHDRHPLLPARRELGRRTRPDRTRSDRQGLPAAQRHRPPSRSQPAGSPATRQPIEQPGTAPRSAGLAAVTRRRLAQFAGPLGAPDDRCMRPITALDLRQDPATDCPSAGRSATFPCTKISSPTASRRQIARAASSTTSPPGGWPCGWWHSSSRQISPGA